MDSKFSPGPGQLIQRMARMSNRWIEPRLQEMGLAVAQVPVFGALQQRGSMSQRELATLLHVEQPTMAQLLNRMERDGLIVRKPDPNDGRSSLISITPRALKRSEAARDVLMEGRQISLQGFTKAEVDTLQQLLQRMVDNMEAELGK
ncbi:MarR family winged helix-turn-helix transcriptional regulator [Terriglobus sp. TAA 43]|uniref:MarR family winged helix-turn-helix transcriptional regulator n=1 Tax=Terriglobus sp. TAA 43 TaxID=278961 RepID=UPI0006485E7D|nr:MarR family transcriptional regulator [Terriglobus sp. TAA 43]